MTAKQFDDMKDVPEGQILVLTSKGHCAPDFQKNSEGNSRCLTFASQLHTLGVSDSRRSRYGPGCLVMRNQFCDSRRRQAKQSGTALFRRLLIEPLDERVMLTLTAQLLKDINTEDAGLSPGSPVVEMNGIAYFAGNTDGDFRSGYSLWRSDGTVSGTLLVKDVQPGGFFSFDGDGMANVSGTLFFSAKDPASGYDLWKTDGTTAGTVLVANGTGFGFQRLNDFTNVGGRLFFVANDGTGGDELWTSDGTVGGTLMLKDIQPGPFGSEPKYLTNANGTLLFVANDGTTGYELWKSDGTATGTQLVKDIRTGSPDSAPHELTAFQGKLFFAANNGTSGIELWSSDGTSNGTAIVKDIDSGANSSFPRGLTTVGNALYFWAHDATNRDFELWKSDGTSVGTTLIKTINPSRSDDVYYVPPLANVNGTLLFIADDGLGGYQQLWKSDGTGAGTTVLERISNGQIYGGNANFASVGGMLFFVAVDPAHGQELWKSDGSIAGTVLLKDIQPGSDDSVPAEFASAGGKLFFSAYGNSGPLATGFRELWTSDGTTVGTKIVPRGAGTTASSNRSWSAVLNGFDYFSADDGALGNELWRTDGTVAGTTLVKDIDSTGGSGPRYLANVNGTLYFAANDGVNGDQLWKSDGTQAGTSNFQNISGGGSPQSITNVGGTVFFVAFDAMGKEGLWKSNGTPGGAIELTTVDLGQSAPEDPGVNVGGILFFPTNGDGTTGPQLWTSDGTQHGTGPLFSFGGYSWPSDLTNVNGTLFFVMDGNQLWKSDGTADGTAPINIPAFSLSSLVNLNGTLYFSANDGRYGYELWKTDGTFDGTVLVKDINVEFSGSRPSNLTNVNGTLYFSANDGVHGYELWKSDGTANGTFLAADIAPGPSSSQPSQIAGLNGEIVLTAADGVHGREPMRLIDINRAPSFIKGPDENSTDESSQQTIHGWAMNISPGPPDEANQKLHFVISTDVVSSTNNKPLFAAGPVIDPNTGTLTFTPVPNVVGTAQVIVTLMDDGGVSNGGSNISGEQRFVIQITKARVWHNVIKAEDVNGDTQVAPNDLTALISFLNGYGATDVPKDGRGGGPYCDVDADGVVAPKDLSRVIGYLNAFGAGEGEAPASARSLGPPSLDENQSSTDALFALLAAEPYRTKSVRGNDRAV